MYCYLQYNFDYYNMDQKLCHVNKKFIWKKIDKKIYDQLRYFINEIFDEIFLIDVICDLYYVMPYINSSGNFLVFNSNELVSIHNKHIDPDDILNKNINDYGVGLTHIGYMGDKLLLFILKNNVAVCYDSMISKTKISMTKIDFIAWSQIYKPKSDEHQKIIQYIYDNCNPILNLSNEQI